MTEVIATPSRPLVGSGVLLSDDAGRVLLVEPTYKSNWEIPGGGVEAGETPREACERELFEELGLRLVMGPLLVADWAPHHDGDRVMFLFDGGRLGPEQRAAIRLPPDELKSHRFVGAEELGEATSDRLARRVRAAIAARAAGQMVYLEHGRHPVASQPPDAP